MDDPRSLLAELVSIDSINPSLVPGGAGETEIARFVGGWLEARGLEVDIADVEPGRPNVVARARGRGGGRTLLLNAHMDVVGVDGMDQPFQPRVEGDRLYGRGAYDMKAGLAAIMVAAAAAAERGWPATWWWPRSATRSSHRSAHSRWRGRYPPTRPSSPSRPSSAIQLAIAHKGFSWHEIVVHGRAAHGARPDVGIDAIAGMGHVLVGAGGAGGEACRRRRATRCWGRGRCTPRSSRAAVSSRPIPRAAGCSWSGARFPARRRRWSRPSCRS